MTERHRWPSGTTAVGDNPITEDALDQVVEDSFPASDPPSHTPTTSLGAPQDVSQEQPQGHLRRRALTVAGGAALVILVAVALVRRRLA